MDISSKWDMNGDCQSVTVIGTDDRVTVEVATPGCINVSIGRWPYIDTAMELIEGLPAKVKEVVEVWEREEAVRQWLVKQVDIESLPIDLGGVWEPRVSKGGLYWVWYLEPPPDSSKVSLAITLYLDIELPPSGIPTVRRGLNYKVEPHVLIDRYLCIEVRDRRFTGERVIPLYRVGIPHDVAVITMDTLRQCMAGDPLNISLLCDIFDLRFPIHRGT